MANLQGRLYFTNDDGDYFGMWDSATNSFIFRTIYDPELIGNLPLVGPSPGINEAGSWMQLADGRMFLRIDDNYRANPDYAPFVMGLVWDSDLTVATVVAVTEPWPYNNFQTDTTYIDARFSLGCLVNGENWITWQHEVANGEPQPSYSVIGEDLSLTQRAFWLPYSGMVEPWGACQVYNSSDGFIYRGMNTDDQMDRYNPDTGVFEMTSFINTAIDPNKYRWHSYGFIGFAEDGGVVVIDWNSSDLHPPAENGKSPGLFKVFDPTVITWNDLTVSGGTWEATDAAPVRYFTPAPPAGTEWAYWPSGNSSQSAFIIGNRVFFSVMLPEASWPDQYPVGPDDMRFGYDDIDGSPLGNSCAIYSMDLTTGEVELEVLIPFRWLMPDGSETNNSSDYWFDTYTQFMGMTFVPSPGATSGYLGSRRRFW